jgi:hypothetical protein
MRGVLGASVAVVSLVVFEGGDAHAPRRAEAQAIEKPRRDRRGGRDEDELNDVSRWAAPWETSAPSGGSE